jgi:hypothetical protein
MNRMQRLSRALRRFAAIALSFNVIVLILAPAVLFLDKATLEIGNKLLGHLDAEGIRFGSAHLGWMLRAFVAVFLATYWTLTTLSLGALIRLLRQFEEGEAFSLESIRLVRFLGWIQVAMGPIGLLVQLGMASIARAITTQSIHLSLDLASSSAVQLFFGGVVLLVAYVMEEGCRLKSEQDLVI